MRSSGGSVLRARIVLGRTVAEVETVTAGQLRLLSGLHVGRIVRKAVLDVLQVEFGVLQVRLSL